MSDATVEVLVRQARMKAAKADAARSSADVIAAMAAGAGAELVASQYLAREALAARIRKGRK